MNYYTSVRFFLVLNCQPQLYLSFIFQLNLEGKIGKNSPQKRAYFAYQAKNGTSLISWSYMVTLRCPFFV